MMLEWVRPTPLVRRTARSASGKALPRTRPAQSQTPAKTRGSVFMRSFRRESVDPAIGRHIEPPLGGQDGREMTQPGHLVAGIGSVEHGSPGVGAEAMQPVVALGARDPHDAIRASVAGRYDRA